MRRGTGEELKTKETGEEVEDARMDEVLNGLRHKPHFPPLVVLSPIFVAFSVFLLSPVVCFLITFCFFWSRAETLLLSSLLRRQTFNVPSDLSFQQTSLKSEQMLREVIPNFCVFFCVVAFQKKRSFELPRLEVFFERHVREVWCHN